MKRSPLIAVLAMLLIFAFAAPATAGGPNDNGNGNRYEIVTQYEISDIQWGKPICQGGEKVDWVNSSPGVYSVLGTSFHKPDGSRYGGTLNVGFESYDGSYTQELREKVTLKACTDGYCIYNRHTKTLYGDFAGVYAYTEEGAHYTYNANGELKVWHIQDPPVPPAFVCLRDTILP